MSKMLLRNARVLTCLDGIDERPFDGDILIDNGRIAALSHGRMAMDAAAARAVDVNGATVLPGLGDAHTHISWTLDFVFDHAALTNAPPAKHAFDVAAVVRTFVESGYTMIVGAGVSQPGDDLFARAAIDRGEIPGPRITPSGTMVTAEGALGADSGMMEVARDADSLREIVKRQCDGGVQAVKIFISGDSILPEFPSEDSYMDDAMLEAAVAEADRHGAFITVHARGADSIARAARTGVRIIHHGCFLDEQALRAIERRGHDVFVCPGLHYLWAMVNGKAAPWGMSAERVREVGYVDEYEAQIDGLKMLRASGVNILAGGDFGHQWTRHGSYAAELQRYVELVGMTPVEALHTATRNFAPVFGLDVGGIREGAIADLLVVDGDPTEDISLLQQPERRRAVIKDGAFAYINPALYP